MLGYQMDGHKDATEDYKDDLSNTDAHNEVV